MTDLVTVYEYKDAEGMRGEKDDDRLGVIVPQVSDLVKKYCGTSFVDYFSTNKVETFNIDDLFTQVIILSESPVTAVDKVEERTAYSEAYSELTTSNYEYYFDSAADGVVRTTKNGEKRSWAKGMGAVRITYNAGYASTPRDLQLAIHDLITYYMKDEHKMRQSLGGASLQNQGTSGNRNSTDFPDHIKRVLDLHRVVI
ncbi:MAG TPA: hypothetical protein DCW83_10160 [Saprospirales bacterium]|nr:hypothetical protein [Saprospirales bacterium]